MGALSKGLLRVAGFLFSATGQPISEVPLFPLPVPAVSRLEPLPLTALRYLRTRRRRTEIHERNAWETVCALNELAESRCADLKRTPLSKRTKSALSTPGRLITPVAASVLDRI